jgi:thiol:disulfide interchange protein DsbA
MNPQRLPMLACLLALTLSAFGATSGLSPFIVNPNAYLPGRHYQLIKSPQPAPANNQIEVIEAFSFACPHCFEFEPLINAWRARLGDDVAFQRLPVVFGRTAWKTLAKAFFTAETLNVVDRVEKPIFDAIHVEKRQLADAAALRPIFEAQGVSADAFLQAFNSKEIDEKVQAAEQKLAQFGVTGVPTLIVNGKYETSTSLTGDYRTLLKVVDYLIAKEREAKVPAE